MGERSPAGVTRKFSGIFFAPSLAVVPGTEYDVITEMLPLFLIFLPTYIYTYTFSFFFSVFLSSCSRYQTWLRQEK